MKSHIIIIIMIITTSTMIINKWKKKLTKEKRHQVKRRVKVDQVRRAGARAAVASSTLAVNWLEKLLLLLLLVVGGGELGIVASSFVSSRVMDMKWWLARAFYLLGYRFIHQRQHLFSSFISFFLSLFFFYIIIIIIINKTTRKSRKINFCTEDKPSLARSYCCRWIVRCCCCCCCCAVWWRPNTSLPFRHKTERKREREGVGMTSLSYPSRSGASPSSPSSRPRRDTAPPYTPLLSS